MGLASTASGQSVPNVIEAESKGEFPVAKAKTSKILGEVLAANADYAADFGDKGKLPMPPGRSFAILTCMDARLDPAKYAGLAEGDAHVIRNAGGRATDDAIRSLVIFIQASGNKGVVRNSS